jgi:hypothetical protein
MVTAATQGAYPSDVPALPYVNFSSQLAHSLEGLPGSKPDHEETTSVSDFRSAIHW